MVTRNQEKSQQQLFSERLLGALTSNSYGTGPTELWRNFNARWEGRKVTVHAVRKWLVGEAIPSQAKLLILASMLAVTAEFLRYGTGTEETAKSATPKLDTVALKLVSDITGLPEPHRTLAVETIRSLVRLSAGKGA